MIKKYIIPILIGVIGFGSIAHATTVFNSNQVGTNPVNTYYLQTNGATSTWVALTVPSSTATTTINGVSGPTFTFTLQATTTGANAYTISTSSQNLLLYLLKYTSGTDINVDANGVINFVNTPGFITTSTISINGVSGNVFTGLSTSTGANPTASIGTSAVNGSANTFLRSDGAPAINQAATFSFSALGNTTSTGNVGASTLNASTSITNQGVKSAIVVDSSTGLQTGYGGSSCTNQGVSGISATGTVTCTTFATSTGGSAAGSSTYIQYNTGGSFDATSTFTFTSSTQTLSVGSLFNTSASTSYAIIATTTTFTYSGSVASYTIPNAPSFPNHSVNQSYYAVVNVQGASGGGSTAGSTGVGGFGGSATGTLSSASSTAGTVLYLNIGGIGATSTNQTGGNGGYNGGATGGSAIVGASSAGGGGGGSTWVSATSTFSTSTVYIVGAGGGGACGNSGSPCNGNNGGGLTGAGGSPSGGGGTQSAAGAGGVQSGGNTGTAGSASSGGIGANGISPTFSYGGGGGGGGYYGGGGGAGGGGSSGGIAAGAGGGGSSFMGSNITSTSTAALSSAGNGKVTITMYQSYSIPNIYLATSSAMFGGHIITGGPVPTIPNGTTLGNDTAGTVTVASSTTSYTLTFGQAWGNAPSCTANVASGTSAYFIVNPSTTSTLFTANTALATSTQFQYQCLGY